MSAGALQSHVALVPVGLAIGALLFDVGMMSALVLAIVSFALAFRWRTISGDRWELGPPILALTTALLTWALGLSAFSCAGVTGIAYTVAHDLFNQRRVSVTQGESVAKLRWKVSRPKGSRSSARASL